jgi:hypothetical protein
MLSMNVPSSADEQEEHAVDERSEQRRSILTHSSFIIAGSIALLFDY